MKRIALGFLATLATLAACSPATGRPVPRATLSDLPMDSIVKTLGAGVASRGIAVGAGHNDAIASGRFEQTYTLEFAAQPSASQTVHALAISLRDIAGRRGVRVTGSSSSDDAVESLTYATRSVVGWLGIVAAKPRTEGLDRYVVVVTEVHQLPER